MSADGRFITFESNANNLVAGDSNGTKDVFVRDNIAGTTTRVSVATDGTQGNRESYDAGISPDGRYVTYASRATNLVPGDTNNFPDIFIHDMTSGTTTRIALYPDATPYPTPAAGAASASAGVAIPSLTPLYVPTGLSGHAVMSADDHTLVFNAEGPALGSGNGVETFHVFVDDLTTGTITRGSVASDGTLGDNVSSGAIGAAGDHDSPSISADGRYTAFQSQSSNLVPGDPNTLGGIFVHDLITGTTSLVSVAADGTPSSGYSPAISADGRSVAFISTATNLVPDDTVGQFVADVFVRDLVAGTTTRVSVASGGAQSNGSTEQPPAISGDGRYIAFESNASNLVTEDPVYAPFDVADPVTNDTPNVFVHDLVTNQTTRVSVVDGPETYRGSLAPEISTDGRYVAFDSWVPYLVPHDSNADYDVFLYDRGA